MDKDLGKAGLWSWMYTNHPITLKLGVVVVASVCLCVYAIVYHQFLRDLLADELYVHVGQFK